MHHFVFNLLRAADDWNFNFLKSKWTCGLKTFIVILQAYQNYIYTNFTYNDISTGPTSLNNSASASTILS